MGTRTLRGDLHPRADRVARGSDPRRLWRAARTTRRARARRPAHRARRSARARRAGGAPRLGRSQRRARASAIKRAMSASVSGASGVAARRRSRSGRAFTMESVTSQSWRQSSRRCAGVMAANRATSSSSSIASQGCRTVPGYHCRKETLSPLPASREASPLRRSAPGARGDGASRARASPSRCAPAPRAWCGGSPALRPAGPRRGARSPAVLFREVQAPSLVSLSVDRWAGVRSMR